MKRDPMKRGPMKRGRSIRRQLFAMLAVPLVALVGLYSFALVSVIEPVLELRVANIADKDVRNPGGVAVKALQAERKAAELYLAGGRVDGNGLQAARATSDNEVAKFRQKLVGSELRKGNDQTSRAINDAIKAMDQIPVGRQAVDNAPDRITARAIYTNLIWAVFALFDSLPASVTPEVTEEESGETAVSRVTDQMSEEDAIIAGLSVARRYTPADAAVLASLIGGMGNQVAQAIVLMSGTLKTEVDQLLGGAVAQQVYVINRAMLGKGFNGGVPPIDVASWEALYFPALKQIEQFLDATTDNVNADIRATANAAVLNLALTGLGGLLAVALSLFLAIRLGRSLAVRLAGLRGSALELADVRLPDVVSRLRRGERVDAAIEAPPLDLGDDEIGQVGEAFNRVRRTAIEAAVQEANLRHGINRFFVNIARRSQGLLHRQLAVLDSMERRTTEPEELADLFRVDHLATRMRRHAEDLVILAGNAPGRGWRQPVPMIDVIRGAISEIEDYERVNLSVVGDEALVGRAVGDIVHLLAELIENGTDYSPPQTQVAVTGQVVGNGFAVEIEDRGLGMNPDALLVLNRQLLDPPDFDLANSAQLGLFVVARLAAKHGVRVQLRPSIFGGISAVVLIPADLVATPGQIENGQPTVAHGNVTQELPVVGAGTHHRSGDALNPRGPAASGGHDATAHTDANGAAHADANGAAHAGPNGAAHAGPNGTGQPDAYRYSGPGQPDRFDWLRDRGKTPAHFEVPLRLASSTDRPQPPTERAAPRTVQAVPDPIPGPGPGLTLPRQARPSAAEQPSAPRQGRPRGLPRRVRQANLAPQLQNAMAPALIADEIPPPTPPDVIRARMSAFQSGTNRGRRAGEADTGQKENQ
jgi:signal transduction histidine kinase